MSAGRRLGYNAADGVTGEFKPAPADHPFLRPSGKGLGALDAEDDLERAEQARLLHDGQLLSVHSWELVTAVDGPGTRMTTFLSGCPLACLYCHNPDTLDMRRGNLVPTKDLTDRMRRYRKIFKRTGGGITLSGGEPLMQPKGVAKILRFAKKNNIHTAIDTSGFLGERCTDEMLKDLDLCLLDIKSGIPETYRKTTGQELAPTLDFAKRLGEAGVAVWVRFVLVPGLTDDPENIFEVARIAASIPTLERVEVLPFHQMGRDKWDALGIPYLLEGTKPPSKKETKVARKIFKEFGLEVY